MITILYADDKSVYKTLKVDVWDKQRDARQYFGTNVVIAHPPCGLWGRLYKQCKQPTEMKDLARLAVRLVKRNGGIIEHPAHSKLWKEMNLPYPGQTPTENTFSLSVDQHWWGYPCKKETWLYIVGCLPVDLPPIPLNFDAITHRISDPNKKRTDRTGLKRISRSKVASTPLSFASWLIETAEIIDKKRGYQVLTH